MYTTRDTDNIITADPCIAYVAFAALTSLRGILTEAITEVVKTENLFGLESSDCEIV